jgi:SAM-dependent methyltransferase
MIDWLERSARGLGGMKRYVAYRLGHLTGGGTVLDVGCGAGHDLDLLEREGCTAVGVDLSRVMLDQAKARGQRLASCVGESLPCRSGAFDACRIERLLMHARDPIAVLAEASRVVRSGGFLAVFEPDWETLHIESSVPDGDSVTASLINVRWPSVGARLVELVEGVGLEIVDEVEERSRSGRLSHLPFNIELLVGRAIADGRVDAAAARAWRADLERRDEAGSFRARWTKRLVVAWRPDSHRTAPLRA